MRLLPRAVSACVASLVLVGVSASTLVMPAAAGVAPPKSRHDLQSFTGLGTWVDAYDFSPEYTDGKPTVTPAMVDAMWQAGVRTLYLQAATFSDKVPGPLIDPDLLAGFLGRAHYRSMRVVAWYVPDFTDTRADVRRLVAMRNFRTGGQAFDALGVDIEYRNGVPDHTTRTRRLVDLTKKLRAAVPDIPLSAIVMPAVVLDAINPNFWPGFPWKTLRSYYDVWQPMSYWTVRAKSSGWHDAYKYTYENIRLTRRDLASAYAPVSVIGGIGDDATGTEYQQFIRATKAQHSIGASIYDWHTTDAASYPTLRGAPTTR